MICIELGNNPKPLWWPKFMDYVYSRNTSSDDDFILIESDGGKEWYQAVNLALVEFGGRLNRNWHRHYYYITFRQEMNYTLFVLKFTQ